MTFILINNHAKPFHFFLWLYTFDRVYKPLNSLITICLNIFGHCYYFRFIIIYFHIIVYVLSGCHGVDLEMNFNEDKYRLEDDGFSDGVYCLLFMDAFGRIILNAGN